MPVADSIGIFDSGIGGLSILRALIERMPEQNYIYMADSKYAPYGERDTTYVINRSEALVEKLLEAGSKIIVVACNTATAQAIKKLREKYPDIPFVGVEPAIKQAISNTENHNIGILATEATFSSQKFKELVTSLQTEQEKNNRTYNFFNYAPTGLALAIEDQDHKKIDKLIRKASAEMRKHNCDIVVLGCTHYPLVFNTFEREMRNQAEVIYPARAIALQTQHLLPIKMGQKRPPTKGTLTLKSTGSLAHLEAAVEFYVNTPLFTAP